MALIALFCALAIGSPATVDRNDLIIEARAYSVTDPAYKLQGPTLKISKPPKDYPNLKISSVIGIDGEKLRGRNDMSVVSKPILKVTSGKSAQWVLNLFGTDEKPEISRFTLTPTWQKGDSLDFVLSLGMDRKDTPKESWTFSESAVLKTDQYYAILISSPQRRMLYTFKVQLR